MRKRLISIAILLLLSVLPARATITLGQHTGFASAGANTITSTGSGSLLVVSVGMVASGATISTVSCTSSCGTWVICAACAGSDASSGHSTGVAYVLNSTAGATSFTVTASAGIQYTHFTEYTTTSGPMALDQTGNKACAASTTCTGVTLSAFTGTNDVVYEHFYAGNTISAINGTGWTSPADRTNTNRAAITGHINTASTTAPSVTQTSTTDAVSAIAFKEAAAASCITRTSMTGSGQC